MSEMMDVDPVSNENDQLNYDSCSSQCYNFTIDDNSIVAAIQALEGQTPAEKYHNLEVIAIKIIENQEECEQFLSTGVTDRVKSGLVPLLRITVGKKLKSNEAVIEALKSEDVTVANRALRSKFFFDPSTNPHLNPEYFITELLPNISVRTRCKFIKVLGRHLTRNPSLADEFYSELLKVIPEKQVLPLAVACSEKRIAEEKLLYREGGCPKRLLRSFFLRYPQLVIRYLESEKPSKCYTKFFLPLLLKRHTVKFAEFLSNDENWKFIDKLNPKKTKTFMKSAFHLYVENPHYWYLKMCYKTASQCLLRIGQYEKMFQNFFPFLWKREASFEYNDCDGPFECIYSYLTYYPQNKKESLILSVIKSPEEFEPLFLEEPFFFRLITDLDMKKRMARKMLESCRSEEKREEILFYLPPEQSLPELKELILKSPDESCSENVVKMFLSCAIFGDTGDRLLETLRFYKDRLFKEPPEAYSSSLMSLSHLIRYKFDFNLFKKEHFQEITSIVKDAHSKDQLLKCLRFEHLKEPQIKDFGYTYAPTHKIHVLEKLLEFYFKDEYVDSADEEIQKDLDNLVAITTDIYLKKKSIWPFRESFAKLPKKCAIRLLTYLKKNYNIDHDVWKQPGMKHYVSLNFLKASIGYKKKNPQDHCNPWNLGDENMSMIEQFVKEFLSLSCQEANNKFEINHREIEEFRKLVRINYPVFYQENNKHPEEDPSPDLHGKVTRKKTTLDEMLTLMKHNHRATMEDSDKFLDLSRKTLASGEKSLKRKFFVQYVRCAKLYDRIPCKMLERCLKEIDDQGSLLIIGILYEGKYFNDIANQYMLMRKNSSNMKNYGEIDKQFTRAMSYANPPVDLNIVFTFCNSFFNQFTVSTLYSVARRTHLNTLFDLWYKRLSNNTISLREVELSVVFNFTTYDQVQKIVESIIEKSEPTTSAIVTKNILYLFIKRPNEKNWSLLVNSIDRLAIKKLAVINTLREPRFIKQIPHEFFSTYIEKCWSKIESISNDKVSPKKKNKWLLQFFTRIQNLKPMILFSNDFMEKILKWIVDSLERNLEHTNFTINYLSPEYDKFEERLNKFFVFLENKIIEEDSTGEVFALFKDKKRDFSTWLIKFIAIFMVGLRKNNYKARLVITDRMILLVESRLDFCKFSICWLNLQLFKEWFEIDDVSVSEKEWGIRCGKKTEEWINRISKELSFGILKDIGVCAYIFISNRKNEIAKYDFVDGLMEGHDYYGSLIGINFLIPDDREEVSYERFDGLEKYFKIWSEHSSPVVRTALHTRIVEASKDLPTLPWNRSFHMFCEYDEEIFIGGI